jgi:hypothetical protein
MLRAHVRRRAVLASAMLAALTAACSSGPTIRSEVDPTADFAAYRTFGFFAPFGLDREGYGTPVGNLVRTAVRAELTRRGLQYVDEGGDLQINAGGNVVDKQRVDTVPGTHGYYGYRHGRYGMWAGYDDVVVTDYQEGTLTIDAVDRARKQMVWSGIAVGRVTEATREQRDQIVPAVVAEIFATFPVPAPPTPARDGSAR